MDLRTRTTLLCAAFALAIAMSILLRSGKRRRHYLISSFSLTLALWYTAQWLSLFFHAPIWFRLTSVLTVLMPLQALYLFDTIAPPGHQRSSSLMRVALALAVPLLAVSVSRYQPLPAVRTALFIYSSGLLLAGLISLAIHGRRSTSRSVKERTRLLVSVGSLALAFSMSDFIWFIGASIPPFGAVLTVVFLFALAESIRHERLVDRYEMLGRLFVSTALAFCLAGIFWVFVTWVGFDTMYLNAVLAALAILVLFEPLRAKVEERIHTIIFRQRRELELAVRAAQDRLMHVVELDHVGETITSALDRSRRLTGVALYLLDADGNRMSLRNAYGVEAVTSIEVATIRPLLQRLRRNRSVVLEDADREAADSRSRGVPDADLDALLEAGRLLGPLRLGVVFGILTSSEDIVGLLVVQDDRVRDALSPDEIALLEELPPTVASVIENSRAYDRIKERDRLAALGQMAAGIAHEIKNPLGAIKGAAQLLLDTPPETSSSQRASHDFLDIIIEEVDRLDRVVGSVLDYARPQRGNPTPIDVNAVVRRTLQVMGPLGVGVQVELHLQLDDTVPPVRMDPEQLRQVLMNLVHNAADAMGERGQMTISTRAREGASALWTGRVNGPAEPQWVDISVRDTGKGIPSKILSNIFVPFFTTKSKGTGLGLPISQRIAQAAGGSIEVQSKEGQGATFVLSLPSATATEPAPSPPNTASDTLAKVQNPID